MTASKEIEFSVSDEPGWAPGHFPGDALMPGALLLDHVLRQLRQADAIPAGAASVAQSKFTQPVRPGERITLAWTTNGTRLKFECSVAAKPVCSGQVSTQR